MSDYVYASVNGSPENLDQLLSAYVLAFDVEGSGTNLGTSIPYGFSLTHSSSGAYYASVDSQVFRDLLADGRKLKIAHNAKYDYGMMGKANIMVNNFCCTMIAAHLLEEPQLSLKALGAKYLGLNIIAYADLKKAFASMSMEEMLEYSGPHSIAALMLWPILERMLKYDLLVKVFWDVEMPLVPVLSEMELNGVVIDESVLNNLGKVFDEKIATLGEALDYWSGTTDVNFNSPDQVAEVFHSKLGIPSYWRSTKKGRPSVSADYFEAIKDKHPIIPPYLMFKHYKTLKNSYVRSLGRQIQSDGRVYGSFNQTRTRTSRLSSSDPNLQKIPQRTADGRLIRRAFVAPEGKVLMKADYDLLELKMMAICSKDQALLDAFRAGRDIHEETAIKVFRDKSRRPEGKTLDFQIIYGGGGIALRSMFFGAYPQVKPWIDETTNTARSMGYIRTLNGRKRTIPEYASLDSLVPHAKVVSHGDREVISTIVQGTSAEVVKIGMRRVWEKLRSSDVKMLLQVHDELIFEVPRTQVAEVAEVVREAMTYNEYEIPLTVSVEVGPNWAQMTKVAGG